MIWLASAAVLLIVILVIDRLRPLQKTAMIAIGAAFIAAGALRLAYIEWDYLSIVTEPFDAAIPLDHVASFRFPTFAVARTGEYDVWLQTDRPSPLINLDCYDPDYGGEKLCPHRPPGLDLRWTVRDGMRTIGVGETYKISDRPPIVATKRHLAPSAANASDETPIYRYLGNFAASRLDRLTLEAVVASPEAHLAARHPRLIVGLSDAETAPAGYFATLFCVLCVFGGGFILLKTLVPRKSPA
ncbi:MAG TPA: hypothetical protein VJ476_10470 [Rhizomicrobium sp.]|nr:hypothetical protein [Rhizomicrobium sp.]